MDAPRILDPIRTPADRRAVQQGFYFDYDAAYRVWTFFHRFLKHTKATAAVPAGSSFDLLPWQWQDVVAPLFGWKRPDGTRRYREAYIEIPKKNGKSTLSAGLGLYLLMADNEPGAEVYCAAADRNQASIVFREALHMVNASPALQTRLWPVPSQKILEYSKTDSFWQVLSAESNTKEGFNIHGLIFDEFHAQPSPDLYDVLKYGGAARVQPLFIYITTAGFDRTSVCWVKHCYADGILTDEIDDLGFFAYIANAGEEDDWQAESTWRKANPSYGVTIAADHFSRMAKVASQSPLEENTFKRYHLNLWTGQDVRWISVERWDECVQEYTEDDLLGEDCYAGLDLAATRDINALVLYFPAKQVMLPYFWVPKAALKERARQKRTRLDAWVQANLIKTTDGNASDYDVIEEDVKTICDRFRVQKMGIDRWNSLQISQHFMDEGIDVVGIGQGTQGMSAPMKALERMVVNHTIHHNGNAVLRWMFGNVAVKVDPAGNIKPDKSKVADKIDGIVALIIALATWMEDDEGPNPYEGQGIDFM